MDLKDKIEKLIASAYVEEDTDDEYQESFAEEGDRKGNYIIEDLRYKESEGKFKTQDLCNLSIGGADGSEIEKVLKNTNISKGLLIET